MKQKSILSEEEVEHICQKERTITGAVITTEQTIINKLQNTHSNKKNCSCVDTAIALTLFQIEKEIERIESNENLSAEYELIELKKSLFKEK